MYSTLTIYFSLTRLVSTITEGTLMCQRSKCSTAEHSISRDTSNSCVSRLCLFHGTERNAVLFHGTDKCDHGTIILILEYLTRNGSI